MQAERAEDALYAHGPDSPEFLAERERWLNPPAAGPDTSREAEMCGYCPAELAADRRCPNGPHPVAEAG